MNSDQNNGSRRIMRAWSVYVALVSVSLAWALLLLGSAAFALDSPNHQAAAKADNSGIIQGPLLTVPETLGPVTPTVSSDNDRQSYCHWQSYAESAVYAWKIPDDQYNVQPYAQRFSVSQPETLATVEVAIYDFEGAPWQNDGVVGNDDIYVQVFNDDGFGLPGVLLAEVTLPAGTYPYHPVWASVDFSAYNLVFLGDFHVAVSSSGNFALGDYEVILSDDGYNPLSRSSAYYDGHWRTMPDLWGIDCNFLIRVELCGSIPQGIHFSQVDWVLADSTFHNTDWGRISVDVEEFTRRTGRYYGYLNGFTDTGWVIQNLILDTSRYDGQAVTYFDLGIPLGTDVESLSVHLEFSDYPVVEFGDSPRITFPVDSTSYAVGGVGDQRPDSVPPPPARVTFDGRGETYHIRGTPLNVECAFCQCVPCAISNNLQYLENQYSFIDVPHDNLPGLKGDNTLVGQHDTYTNRPATSRTSGDGLWFTPWVQGKFGYLNANSLGMPRLVHHHQGYGYGQPLPTGDFTHASITTIDETDATLYIDFDWLCDCVQRGEAVELCFNSHAVRISQCGQTGGQDWLFILHDRKQTNEDPSDNLGTEEVQYYVTRNTSTNRLEFGGWDVSFVLATAPAPHEVMMRDCPDDVGVEHSGNECGWDICRSPGMWIDNDWNGTYDEPLYGVVNRLYFRGRNIGLNTMSNVTLNAYFVDPAMGLYFPNPNATAIKDELTQATTFSYPSILSGGHSDIFVNWKIPGPVPPVDHYCIGAVLNHANDPQISVWPRDDNNVAQINMWALWEKAQKTDRHLAGSGSSDDFGPARTVFETRINGCNTLGGAAYMAARFDSASLMALPPNWEPSFDSAGPWLLWPDSCVQIDVYMEALDANHGDSAFLTVEFGPADNPEVVVGMVHIDYRIDNYEPDTIHNLVASVVEAPPNQRLTGSVVRLDWMKPTLDVIGDPEHIRGFYVYRDSIPGVTQSDLLDSLAVDADSVLVGYQWYDEHPLAKGNTRYYRVAAIDGPHSVSALSNEAEVTVGCCIPPLRGNVNYDPSDDINIVDLTFLVAYLFGGGDPPPCEDEADVNADGVVNIVDLTYLVAYLFGGGDPPELCP